MRQSTTLFAQIVQKIPKSMIQNAIAEFGSDRRSRILHCRHHLLALLLGHLLGVNSLRHLITAWSDHRDLATSLGLPVLARSTLADATHARNHQVFRAIAAQVLQAAIASGRGVPGRLKRACYCLDSTCMELCADLYAWALFSRERSAIKLHTLMRTETALPELTIISDGRTQDLTAAKMMPIPPGSIVSMDRGYVDVKFFADLHDQGTVFVTRMKRGMRYRVIHRWKVPRAARGVRCDQEQQIREATAWDETPRFLIHDNDGIFGQFARPVKAERDGRKRSYRSHLDRWLDEAMGIEGLPIPYGAPNASPHVERFMRTLRQEALDHFIFLGADHIRRVVSEFVRYYNGARPSQAIHGIPAPYPELKEPPPRTGRLVALPVLGGVQHDYRLAA